MNKHLVFRSIPSIVSEPDYVGPNDTPRSPIKMLIVVLIASIAVCGIAMNVLASSTLLGHVFWLVVHILYIGGLVYYFGKKWRQYREAEA